jgi:RNA polymerase sigma-70 factor (ECF subfamily)
MQTAQASAKSRPLFADFRDELLKAIPKLRAFAISMSRSPERGDDLVQATLVKALANADKFEPGSNMMGWLYTILRNEFYTEYRKLRHEIEDDNDRYAGLMQISASQEGHMHFLDVRNALSRLAIERREALMLIVSGMSYEDAAATCGCAVGTMKSRVSRARKTLAEMVDDRRPGIGDHHVSLSRRPQKSAILESSGVAA